MPETNEPEKPIALPILQPEENDVLIKIGAAERSIINCQYLNLNQRSRLLEMSMQMKEIVMAGGVLRMRKDQSYVVSIESKMAPDQVEKQPNAPPTRAEQIQAMKAENLKKVRPKWDGIVHQTD